MKNVIVALMTCCLLLAGSAIAAKKDDAYKIDKRTFKSTYKTIAFAPVDADPYLQMTDSVAAMLEAEVTARLQKRGYTVIPSSVLAGIRKTMEAQVGGFKDPNSGRINLAKMQAVREHAFRELWFQHKFDAMALISVRVRKVDMESDRAEWDGAKQKIAHEGRTKQYAGSISVTSVTLAIFDPTDKPLFVFYGGLESLMYRNKDQLLPLAVNQLFLNEKRIRKAAQIAAGPI